MTSYSIVIHHPRQGETYRIRVRGDEYILLAAEGQGRPLPYLCRNGACTTCAVKVLSGEVDQPEAMGLSSELKAQGYALLCVAHARTDLEVELQDEDEVYYLQFGQYFDRGKVQIGLPLEGD